MLRCANILVCFGQGVYFEKVLKSSDTSLWVRNIQMYLSGIVVTLIGVYVNDGDKVLEKGFFFGYTSWVCFVVCKCHQSEGISCLKSPPPCGCRCCSLHPQFWPVWVACTRLWWWSTQITSWRASLLRQPLSCPLLHQSSCLDYR